MESATTPYEGIEEQDPLADNDEPTDAEIEEIAEKELADEETEDSTILDISTELTPPKKMRIDGQEYDLLNFDHLSPDDESRVTATFARLQKVFIRLSQASDDKKARVEAAKMRRLRVILIDQMTTVPVALIEQLGPVKQGKIVEAIREELGSEVISEDEDSEDDSGY